MNFYWLYLIIPCVLYFIRPIKQNKLLFLYWMLLVILSYDNVTDFYYYYEEFFFYKNGEIGEFTERGREPFWILLNKVWNFTDYGVVIIHVLVMIVVVYCFSVFSKKLNIINASIFLFFLFNYTWKHDNIVRQDIAIILGTISIFEILKDDLWTTRRYLKIFLLTIVGIGFHYSAFMLFPIYFFIRWISNVKLNLTVVAGIVAVFVIVCQNEMIQELLKNLGFIFILIGGDYGTHYAKQFINLEMEANGTIGIFLSFFSLTPLIYYKIFNKKAYQTNKVIRTCVNLSWIFVIWKNNLNLDLFTRPAEYLSWFSLWGFAFMLNDIMMNFHKRFNVIALSLCFAYLVCSGWSLHNFINRYYGDNNYMTILTRECYQLKIYQRDRSSIADGYKRYR